MTSRSKILLVFQTSHRELESGSESKDLKISKISVNSSGKSPGMYLISTFPSAILELRMVCKCNFDARIGEAKNSRRVSQPRI